MGDHGGTHIGIGVAAQHQVKVTVVVIVTPRHRAVGHTGQWAVRVTKGTSALIAIEPSYIVAPALAASEQQIGVAVIIIIAPGCRTTGNRLEISPGLFNKGAAIIAIEGTLGNARIPPSDQQIEIAIKIIVGPGQGTIKGRGQGRGQTQGWRTAGHGLTGRKLPLARGQHAITLATHPAAQVDGHCFAAQEGPGRGEAQGGDDLSKTKVARINATQ